MNLLLRLLMTIIRGFFRSKINFLDESTMRMHVWPNDLDLNMHMTNSRYVSVMDLGRTDLLMRTGAAKIMLKNKWQAVLGAGTIRFRRPMNIFQAYDLKTQVIGWQGKWVYIEQKIYSKDILIAHALLKGAFLKGSQTVQINEIFEEFGFVAELERVPECVKQWMELDECFRKNV